MGPRATSLVLALAASSVLAGPFLHDHTDLGAPLPGGAWHHKRDHPAHALFRRQSSTPATNATTYPTVGSPTWTAAYPANSPDVSKLPQAWVDALNAAVSAGNIPNIPQSTMGSGGTPVYPAGVSQDSASVCAATNRVCRNPADTWDAPAGVWGLGFDDGPLPTSQNLYTFLQAQKQHATHFFIGVNILNNPGMFNMAYETLQDDIAVHTWTHPYMTTLSNLELLAQFGWTMQIIHDSTGGRLPMFWRPPYGDVDNRVRAIAQEVFGLRTIIWNQDTEDWSLTLGGTTPAKVHSSLEQWLSGPKSPGLIILEHELSNDSAQAFIDGFPLAKTNGWTTQSVAELAAGVSPWQNAAPGTTDLVGGPGTPVDVGPSGANASTSTGSQAPTSSAPSTSSRGGNDAAGGAAAPTAQVSGHAAQPNAGRSVRLARVLHPMSHTAIASVALLLACFL